MTAAAAARKNFCELCDRDFHFPSFFFSSHLISDERVTCLWGFPHDKHEKLLIIKEFWIPGTRIKMRNLQKQNEKDFFISQHD